MKMSLLFLSVRSMLNRKLSTCLTLLSIALSVALLLGVERVREGARSSFENTISGTDLIIGARSGPIQLLLYSVFHIGDAMQNITWKSYQQFSEHPEVSWSVPLSLGDSHRGYRVVGTNQEFFRHYKYARKQSLSFAQGKAFSDVFHVVLGADVAAKLDYGLGEKIVLAHGLSEVSFQKHDDKPFVVVGVLAKTGTPVDRSLYVPLEGITAMHVDWQDGAPPQPGQRVSAQAALQMELEPTEITAVLLGLRAKMGIFRVQREINSYEDEALLAILPGVSFRELWSSVSLVESALIVVASFVVLAGILGMLSALLTTLNERRREISIIRSLGGKPFDVFALLLSESVLLGLGGCLVGAVLVYASLLFGRPLLETHFGLYLELQAPQAYDFFLLGAVFLTAVLAGILPAFKAYRQSLTDGLSVKL